MSYVGGIFCPQASQTCCDTPPVFGKDFPIPNFLFTLRSGDGGDGQDSRWIRLGLPSEMKFSSRGEVQYTRLGLSLEKKVLSTVAVCGVTQPPIVLKFMIGVEMGDGSDGSVDEGLLFSSYPSTAIVARMLNGFGGRFKSFKLCGKFRSCRSNPNGIVGSFESESIYTICGSSDAMDDFDIISWVSLPDISVELRTIGVFGLGRLGSLDDCSTKHVRVNWSDWHIGGHLQLLKLKIDEKISVYRSNWMRKNDFREWLVLRVLINHFSSGGLTSDVPAFLFSVDELRK